MALKNLFRRKPKAAQVLSDIDTLLGQITPYEAEILKQQEFRADIIIDNDYGGELTFTSRSEFYAVLPSIIQKKPERLVIYFGNAQKGFGIFDVDAYQFSKTAKSREIIAPQTDAAAQDDLDAGNAPIVRASHYQVS